MVDYEPPLSQIAIGVPQETARQLQLEARKARVSRSELVRQYIERGLAEAKPAEGGKA